MFVYVESKEIEKAGWAIIIEGVRQKIMKMILYVMSTNERTKLRLENKPSWKCLSLSESQVPKSNTCLQFTGENLLWIKLHHLKSYVEDLTPRTIECDLIWKYHLCICN